MSGPGAPALHVDGTGMRVAVVSALWHQQVMDGLRAGADRALEGAGTSRISRITVPGSFELPVACAGLARSGRYDALVALGVVIRGGTPHFEYVCQAATHGLVQVSIDTGLPIGFGVLTCDTEEQALARAGLPDSVEDKGEEAALAALRTAVTLRTL